MSRLAPPPARGRQTLVAGFAMLALIVALAAWFTGRQHDSAVAVQLALGVINHVADMRTAVQDAETGQRGYLLTGAESYLAPYVRARTQVPEALAALRADLAGDGDRANDLAALGRLVDQKMAELEQTVALRRSGKADAAIDLVLTDAGKTTMDDIRAILAGMDAAEARRLAHRQAVADQDAWMLQAGTATAAALAALLALALVRDSRRRASELIAANETLEQAVADRTRDLRDSEAALREANAALEVRVAERSRELDRMFRVSTDILAVTDGEGRFQRVSPAWTRILGRRPDEALAGWLGDFVHPDDRKLADAALDRLRRGDPVAAFETRCERADGSFCRLAWRAVAVPEDALVYSVARDVTDERGRDEQLRQSQKMEGVGQLTGGIAHDFNNLLTIVIGSLELLQRGDLLKRAGAELEVKAKRRIDIAMEGARRAATLTHRLLAFSRQQPLQPRPVDLNRLLAGMSDLLARALGETIAVETVSAAGLWRTLADANQLENAILNLAVNARDAMMQQGGSKEGGSQGGRLTLETANMHMDDAYAARQADVAPGQYVMLAVADTGVGMTPQVRARVFEPFFTTKPEGQGTGLGLAQVYGFIKQSGGHVTIYSEPGHGTVVKLYLPRLRGAAGDEGVWVQEAPRDAAAGDIRSRGETILVVEDEAGVRSFSIEVLEELGYRVLAADTAAAAVALVESGVLIDLLFTDIVLSGGGNGRQLAEQVARLRPGVRVLFTTGYTRNAIIHHGRLDDGVHFLGKPFSASALAARVRAVLDEK